MAWSSQVESSRLSVRWIAFVRREAKAVCYSFDADRERALVGKPQREERTDRHQELKALKIFSGKRGRQHSRCAPTGFGAPGDIDLHGDGSEAGTPIGPPLQASGSLILVHRPSIALRGRGCNGSVA